MGDVSMHSGQSQSTRLRSSRQHLREGLDAAFSLDELRQLCFDGGIDYEHFPHDTKDKLVRGLIEHIERRNTLAQFL